MTAKSSSKPASPLLIGGMHRSGTSLIANILRKHGLQTGNDCDHNGESMLFMRWNDWLLEQTGCRWDTPENWTNWIQPLQQVAATQLQTALEQPHARRAYWAKRFHPPTFFDNPSFWGWKNPRNTYTFPIWRKIFPHARMVIMTRHGVDVAASLMLRARKEQDRWLPTQKDTPHRFITGSARCLSLEGAFGLWEQYQIAIEQLRQKYPSDTLLLQYENLLSNPESALEAIRGFCNISRANQPPQPTQIHTARAEAFRDTPDLLAFAQNNAHRLQRFGYEP